ncbi:MAG: 3-dehydroquinate synthase [Propionibacteriaceae bacterium]|nr:3-dehydroquinate synthase [Propionibacteriaceae bacterium]
MSVRVESAQGPYDVHVARGALEHLPRLVGDASRVAVIYPEPLLSVAAHVVDALDAAITMIPVPDAEAAKTAEVLTRCWDALAAAGFTRSDVVIGVGGGTATDLAGFVAASWLRGVRYISIPTSVLAMVDAAVGGKTGINLAAGKNLVGAFYEPVGVICDLALLDSLPERDVRAGLAEVVKAGFIADTRILELAREDLTDFADRTSDRFREAMTRAIQVKATVVAADFREATSVGSKVGREALNYGHTLGHAIEAHAGYTWRHGDAIAVGMAWCSRVSRHILGLDHESVVVHDDLLGGLGLPLRYEQSAWEELRRIMSLDKKARGSMLRIIGLTEFGKPVVIDDPEEAAMEAAYRELS